ncbi:MAG TPA: leucyl aminopeptidase [Chloroflexota bacterium]|nr:leucyl aminopeptidase [Chloroflexota bacterium]
MDVSIRVERASLTGIRTPLLVVNLFEGVDEPSGATGAVDEALGGLIGRLIADGEIKGSLGEITIVHNQGDRARLSADRVAVVGLGKRDDLDLEALRIASATAARKARDLRLGRYATVIHGAGAGGLDSRLASKTVMEASLLSLYTYYHFKTPPDDPRPRIEEIVVVERDDDRAEVIEQSAAEASLLVDAVNLARDLSQAPGNVMTPTVLADRAREMAEARGVSIQVWGKDELREHGMNAILAVNSGSAQEPRFVMMKYDCGKPGAKTLAVVGKGITFDSGGISIKPADHMENMKHDMSGAAATVGFMQAAADLKLPCNVIGIFAATENLPSGSSYKPGDVFKTYQGTFIEIVNTDAEGRVILSDSLAYAVEQNPDAIVDLATLTGACVVALGYHASGAMGNDEGLLALMKEAGDVAGERVWPLPLWKEHRRDIESPIADIKNTGGRAGGALTAAAFLQCFVGGKPWVHLDIAGTAYTENWARTPAYQPPNCATGMGVRLLVELARRWSA